MSEAYVFSSAVERPPSRSEAAELRCAGREARAGGAGAGWAASRTTCPTFRAAAEAPGWQIPPARASSSSSLCCARCRRGLRVCSEPRADHPAGCGGLILGGPAAVGRLNLLPGYRLYPASPCPLTRAMPRRHFRRAGGLTPPLQLEETQGGALAPPQIQIISPAAPPPAAAGDARNRRRSTCWARGGRGPAAIPGGCAAHPSRGCPLCMSLLKLRGRTLGLAWFTPLARGYLLTCGAKGCKHGAQGVPGPGQQPGQRGWSTCARSRPPARARRCASCALRRGLRNGSVWLCRPAAFLDQVLEAETELAPAELLALAKRIEVEVALGARLRSATVRADRYGYPLLRRCAGG